MPTRPVRERVAEALREAGGPARVAELRETSRMRTQTLVEELKTMVEEGEVLRTDDGFLLRD